MSGALHIILLWLYVTIESEGSSQTLVTENIAIPQEVFDKAQEG